MLKTFWKLSLCSVGLSLLIAPVAYADQCSYISKPQAIAALGALNVGQTIYQLCELCGEKVSQPVEIKSLALHTTPDENYWQIMVNEKDIDLAYTYVDYNDPARRRVNLALVANCPADGFTPLLSGQ